MLRFLHGYIPDMWPGLVRRGLIDATSGIKFHQNFDTPDPLRFNTLAAEGGALYDIVRECHRPFYLDRLQGGWWFLPYEFDRTLLQTYQDLCGDWMLGLQMHEWASNMHNDWHRILSGMPDGFVPDAEKIRQAVIQGGHNQGVFRPFLESADVAEYAAMTPPRTIADALQQYDELFARRQEKSRGLLLPCDSVYMAIRQEIAQGARALMPEIGGQIALCRWQIALTRGMARAYQLRWGAYYEPWGGDPFGCAYYKRDFENEWQVKNPVSNLWNVVHFTPTSGSSRALQKRLYYYTLLSGADFMSEEWGSSNTFYDWQDYELTPYGQIKRDFLHFAAQHRDLGQVCAPVALVLPTELEIFDLAYMGGADQYLDYPIESEQRRRQFAHIRSVLTQLLGDSKCRIGNEGHVLSNSGFGDVFDIVYADVPAQALQKYAVVVDLDLHGSLALRHPWLKDQLLSSRDIPTLLHTLTKMLNRMLPCQVTGQLSWILNRTENGHVLGLFNNEGVERTREKGDVLLHEADTQAVIDAHGQSLRVLLGDEQALHRCDDGLWRYDLPAGQTALLEIC